MVKLQLVPHPNAPLFSGEDRETILKQVTAELASGRFQETETYRQYFRQAGYVNLWFFLKHVCGYSGPFDLLNEDLHIDMCNFRQTLLRPGCRGAMFIPRGHYKSTIVTEGGGAWELLRNPNLRIRISNEKEDNAGGFMHTIKDIFEYDEFVAWLYGNPDDPWGSYVPTDKTRWNNTEIVMPNRTRRFREASVEFGGITGAVAGHHFDLHIIDDMVSTLALNSMRGSNAVMMSTRNWFWASEKTLLVSMRNSRVIVVGTRYAVDDVYDEIIGRAYLNFGYPLPNFVPSTAGRWMIYYRKGIEDDKIIFPENFTAEAYREMADEDWWTYATQYLNDPSAAGLAELTSYELQVCQADFKNDQWFILVGEEIVPLSACDVIVCGDPASTERYQSSKTSRTAVGVIATDPKGRRFLIWLRCDYVSTAQLFNWLFEANSTFKGYVRGTFLEKNGPYRMLIGQLQTEQNRRGEYIGLRPFESVGEKTARIRTALDPEFAKKAIYVAEPFMLKVNEEVRAFPQSPRKDILDMLASAVLSSIRPLDEVELAKVSEADRRFAQRRHNQAGW